MTGGVATELAVGETIRVGDVAIQIEHKSGRKVRLRITAPDEMKISSRKKEPGESRSTAETSA